MTRRTAQLLAFGLSNLLVASAFAADPAPKSTGPSQASKESNKPATARPKLTATQRLAVRWGRKYSLSTDDIIEQASAIDESVARTRGPRHEGHEIAEAYAFKFKTLAVPIGSSRKAIMLRSNQPSPENLVELAAAVTKVGVKPEQVTIINLRAENNVEASYLRDFAASRQAEEKLAGAFRSVNLRILDHTIPTPGQVVQVLDILRSPDVKVAVLHCKAGRARTGMMVAAARIALDGWSLADTLDEAREKGLRRPLQTEFIRRFAADWKAGKIKLTPVSKSEKI